MAHWCGEISETRSTLGTRAEFISFPCKKAIVFLERIERVVEWRSVVEGVAKIRGSEKSHRGEQENAARADLVTKASMVRAILLPRVVNRLIGE
jgi:hypothetical protein